LLSRGLCCRTPGFRAQSLKTSPTKRQTTGNTAERSSSIAASVCLTFFCFGCEAKNREFLAISLVAFRASGASRRMRTGGNIIMKKFLIAAGVSAFAVTSAFAQTAVGSSEYYVVRDATTKKCTIVDKKPTTTTTIVDNGTFKTRTEAETGMKTMKGCTEN
jgi:hypothetical protein